MAQVPAPDDRSGGARQHRSGDADSVLAVMWAALRGPPDTLPSVSFSGRGDMPSVFAVSDLAAAALGAAGAAIVELIEVRHGRRSTVRVDRRLASLWFSSSIRPIGWKLPPVWDAIAGDYQCAEGWIRLHTNAPHHRAAALKVLGVANEREAVAAAVRSWDADKLEAAIVEAKGCAAAMRSMASWATHPNGRAVAAEPLVHHRETASGPADLAVPPERPLAGVKVLDLTRVLAGPVATRFLAGFGAEVLRIDPPPWEEPSIVPETTLGKRCARLDLRDEKNRQHLIGLLRQADVVVHGYRPGALSGLGLSSEDLHRIRPGLVEAMLDAYGWTGPWNGRRGFDSLVQMSGGIAEAGMRLLGRDRPTPLPAQALDHATGYLIAAAAIRGLRDRLLSRKGSVSRLSLSRTAALLTGLGTGPVGPALDQESPDDLAPGIEATSWGPARRLRPPLEVSGAPASWDRPASALGSSSAEWL